MGDKPKLVLTMHNAFRLEFFADEVRFYPDLAAEVNQEHYKAVREWVSYLIGMIAPMIELPDYYTFIDMSHVTQTQAAAAGSGG